MTKQRLRRRGPVTKRRRTTTDGLKILDRLYFRTPAQKRALNEAVLNAEIAQEIYALREKANLTQKQLAKLVGTTDSVISRLEDADYEGHSLKMLQRIATALNYRIEVHFSRCAGGRRQHEKSAPTLRGPNPTPRAPSQ